MIKIHLNKKVFSKINCEKLENQSRQIFNILNIDDKEFELNFVRVGKMRKINKSFRGKDESTTILSFVASETRDFIEPNENKNYLGEIFMCASNIKRKAKEEEVSTESMMTRYLLHGILHLLGHEHKTETGMVRMEKKEESILKILDIE